MPNDGLFPKVKSVEELTAEDIPNIIKQKNFKLLAELVKLRVNGFATPLSDALISNIYDQHERVGEDEDLI